MRHGQTLPLERRDLVTPSDLDGLHCGSVCAAISARAAGVTPSDLDGLHCGEV